jgi:hypothetical protein
VLLVHRSLGRWHVALYYTCVFSIDLSMRYDTISTKIHDIIEITIVHILSREIRVSSDECKSYLVAKFDSILVGR